MTDDWRPDGAYEGLLDPIPAGLLPLTDHGSYGGYDGDLRLQWTVQCGVCGCIQQEENAAHIESERGAITAIQDELGWHCVKPPQEMLAHDFVWVCFDCWTGPCDVHAHPKAPEEVSR